ncbi:unnamed protein product [Rodentolepis nana]|uniref:RRM domain-containing protein n=1 Tax=Rodentolepis nana TaxID=102285 RepID=A0A0R3TS54_RODNA|nr:unnamed protein product [Rodentolepis nana]
MVVEKSSPIMDPIQKENVERKLSLRNMCSVKLTNMPKRYNYTALVELVPDMTACRILYDSVSRRPKNHCYIEFSSNEAAIKCAQKLNNAEFLGKKIQASTGADLSESADDYIPLSILLYNLHWKTSKGEIAKHFPTSKSIDIVTKTKKGNVDKRQPGVAKLTFNTIDESISSVDEKQGCIIHGRRVSIHFCPKQSKSKVIGLTVYGFKKDTTESEVRAIFPQANKVDLFPLGGFAVLHYDLFEDCKLDRKNALGAEMKGRKLRVLYKYQTEEKKDLTVKKQTREASGASTSLIFVKNLGRNATEEQIASLFPNTKIVSMPKKGKACRGYAIIDCKSVISARRFLAKPQMLNGRKLVIEPASAKKTVLVNALRAYNITQAWSSIDLVHFPHYKLCVGLFCDVASAMDLNAQVQAEKLPYPADLCAILDADYIVDLIQVESAAAQALVNRSGGKLQGKGVFSTELLACLHPKHSIKEAVATFGVKYSTQRVLVVLLQTPDVPSPDLDKMNAFLPGKLGDLSSLYECFDQEKVSDIYGISGTEFERHEGEKAYVLSVLTRMSASLLSR